MVAKAPRTHRPRPRLAPSAPLDSAPSHPQSVDLGSRFTQWGWGPSFAVDRPMDSARSNNVAMQTAVAAAVRRAAAPSMRRACFAHVWIAADSGDVARKLELLRPSGHCACLMPQIVTLNPQGADCDVRQNVQLRQVHREVSAESLKRSGRVIPGLIARDAAALFAVYCSLPVLAFRLLPLLD